MKQSFNFFWRLLGILGLLIYFLPSLQAADFVEGEVIIKYKEDSRSTRNVMSDPVAEIEHELQASVGGADTKETFSGSKTRIWQLAPDVDTLAAIEQLNQDDRVAYAEPNYIYHLLDLPNDAEFEKLWGLNNAGQTGGTPGSDINAEAAWDVTTGSDITVTVIDTGTDYLHEDLADNIWENPGERPYNKKDDDGNGYIDDVMGFDFTDNNGDPFDNNQHGTHVAGTIAAVGNNGVGVAGVAWQAKIMTMRIFDADGKTTAGSNIKAIEYAVDMGSKLSNNSWGGDNYSQAVYDAIEYAKENGHLFIAAAGNSSRDNDGRPLFPASYDLDNIISVAATDDEDNLAPFSHYGLETVDLAAPGVAIYSTLPGGSSYGYKQGTSMAAPHVTGVAALIWSANPDLSYSQVKSIILNNVDKVDSLAGLVASGGRLNAYKAVLAAQNSAGGGEEEPTLCEQAIGVTQAECETLVALYEATSGDDWDVNNFWLKTKQPCDWYGISCQAGRVSAISLSDNGLSGELPNLTTLTELKELSLADNALTGSIPSLTALTELETLALANNQLSGDFPDLSNASDLQILTLENNELADSLPDFLSDLTQLQKLYVNNNSLQGDLPDLSQLTELTHLYLGNNQLSVGDFPTYLAQLPNLQALNLANSGLQGQLPTFTTSDLQALYLEKNQLSGVIPPSLAQFSGLTLLNLHSNQMFGYIPDFSATQLQNFTLGYNQFSGELPTYLSKLALETFYFDKTQLCEPADADFQAWLAGIEDLRRTDDQCFVADQDGDGVDNVIEAAVIGGDGNQDGVADSEQAHVISFPDVYERANYITIEVSPNCVITDLNKLRETDLTPQDAEYLYPYGLVGFALTECAETEVALYYQGDSVPAVYRQFAPDAQSDAEAWYSVPDVQFALVEGTASLRISFTLRDNQLGDADEQSGRIEVIAGGVAEPDVPLAVELEYFTANKLTEKVVSLSWKTAGEWDTVGFNLVRLEKNAQNEWVATEITQQLLPAKGDLFNEATYYYTDVVSPGKVYYYLLESFDLSGVGTVEAYNIVNMQ